LVGKSPIEGLVSGEDAVPEHREHELGEEVPVGGGCELAARAATFE
jgi:hypothetical protein